MMRNLIILVTVLVTLPVAADSIYKKALPTKRNLYLTSGVVLGGESGTSFTLLGIRRQQAKNQSMERVILDIGDQAGKPLLNKLSYYQVSIEKNPPRIVIDLSQVNQTRVSETAIANLFAKSALVKSTSLTSDPEDNSTKLILNTKGPVAVEVFEMPSNKKASRVVLDLKKAKL